MLSSTGLKLPDYQVHSSLFWLKPEKTLPTLVAREHICSLFLLWLQFSFMKFILLLAEQQGL